MITQTDLFGKDHIIKQCTFDDIKIHFEKIKDVIPEDEKEEFCIRMNDCIKLETAFALEDDSCFLYYKNYKPCCAIGIALYGKNEPLKMITLFAGIFYQIDTTTFKIDFKLHKGKLIQEYKSLLTKISMKRSQQSDVPLVVRIDHLKEKIKQIYEKRGL